MWAVNQGQIRIDRANCYIVGPKGPEVKSLAPSRSWPRPAVPSRPRKARKEGKARRASMPPLGLRGFGVEGFKALWAKSCQGMGLGMATAYKKHYVKLRQGPKLLRGRALAARGLKVGHHWARLGLDRGLDRAFLTPSPHGWPRRGGSGPTHRDRPARRPGNSLASRKKSQLRILFCHDLS